MSCDGDIGSTYDAPLETEHDLADQQHRLARGEEDDEQEASHDTERAEEHPSRTESRHEPAVDDGAEDGADAGTLLKARLPACGKGEAGRCLLGDGHWVAVLGLEGS